MAKDVGRISGNPSNGTNGNSLYKERNFTFTDSFRTKFLNRLTTISREPCVRILDRGNRAGNGMTNRPVVVR